MPRIPAYRGKHITSALTHHPVCGGWKRGVVVAREQTTNAVAAIFEFERCGDGDGHGHGARDDEWGSRIVVVEIQIHFEWIHSIGMKQATSLMEGTPASQFKLMCCVVSM